MKDTMDCEAMSGETTRISYKTSSLIITRARGGIDDGR